MYEMMGLVCLILLIYPFMRLLRSFRSRDSAREDGGKGEIPSLLYTIFLLLLLMIGFILNGFGVSGGSPLHVYAEIGRTFDSYASLSHHDILSAAALFVLGIVAYGALGIFKERLSPIGYIGSCSVLMLNILFTVLYITHTGVTHYKEGLDAVLVLQTGMLGLSLMYLSVLKKVFDRTLARQRAKGLDDHHPKKWTRILYRLAFVYPKMPWLWVIFLFPVFLILQLVLVLFGQGPDSFIRVFLDTSGYNYSQIPAPRPEVIPGDGHYLCTVAVKGNKKLVKPLRAGIRRGNRIAVNRQLLVANAFEHLLEDYLPKCHRAIRRLYDHYGYPLSKHIKTARSANVVYLLMKPLEWFFLLILYIVDREPENRIHIQYSELRK
ncbi:DUF6688 family protein [Camelliibacillus cellulosilyticus]|uniref:DUF6688 family protein n=1 Tax=Camelliibacillus cellulosilyticus TaxID=2174486 RepID=A0ABV9GTQ8_9BACL